MHVRWIIWKSLAPLQVSIFNKDISWEDFDMQHPTEEGKIMENRCSICAGDLQSPDHLMLYCQLAKVLWDLGVTQVAREFLRLLQDL